MMKLTNGGATLAACIADAAKYNEILLVWEKHRKTIPLG